MIAFEKNKKLAIVFSGETVADGWGHEDGKDYGEQGYFRVPTPEGVPEAHGIRVLDDAGTKKCLIGKETDLFESQEDPEGDA